MPPGVRVTFQRRAWGALRCLVAGTLQQQLMLTVLVAEASLAHGFLPARLDVQEYSPGRYFVAWQPNDQAEAAEFVSPQPLVPVFPPHCQRERIVAPAQAAGTHARLTCEGAAGDLRGHAITIAGLDAALVEAFVSIQLLDARPQDVLLSGEDDTVTVAVPETAAQSFRGNLTTGFTHILEGLDHLLFLLTLMLIYPRAGQRIALITAFTLGHSLSLALATLGLVRPPMAPIEVLIAWTVVFASYEAARRQWGMPLPADSITDRFPWLVTGVFGFIHGFGFAAALLEVGLPASRLLLPLAAFNIGVELGQLAVLAVALALGFAWAHLCTPRNGRYRRLPAQIAPPLIGSIAMFWVLERLVGTLGR